MNTPIITMKDEDAEIHYKEYAEQIKQRGDKAEQYLKDLKSTYYHLSQGRKVLDIFEVFKQRIRAIYNYLIIPPIGKQNV